MQESTWKAQRPPSAELEEAAFLPILEAEAGEFLGLARSLLATPPRDWSPAQVYRLYQVCTALETFLDDRGAPENRTYAPLREMVAVLRWLASALSSLMHLDARQGQYELPSGREAAARAYGEPIRKGALEVAARLQAGFRRLQEIWRGLGGAWPEVARSGSGLLPGAVPRLPRNLVAEEEAEGGDGPGSARLVGSYLSVAERFAESVPEPGERLEELRSWQERCFREEQARSWEARVHNLQSVYDHVVAGRPEEREHPDFRSLRGCSSLALHLLEAGTALAHLYERHDLYGRRATRDLAADVIPEEALLRLLARVCAGLARRALLEGVPVARSLLDRVVQIESVELTVPEGLVLHARPASLIVRVVQHHGVPVEMQIGGQAAPADSMLQLLVLVGSHPEERRIRFRGARRALEDLQLLFESGFGESGLERLPDRLAYLRHQAG